jgi:hypothetical protein
MVYFDEIYDLLMDEILEEEVMYFNHLEANYYVSKKESSYQTNKNQSNSNADSFKTLKMMELVRQLDELCD